MKKYYEWVKQEPFLFIPAVVIIYFVLRWYLPVQTSSLNNWYGAFLQIAGGFQLVKAIDKNLRGFTDQTILQTIKRVISESIKAFPLWAKKNVIAMTGTGHMTLTGFPAKIRVSHTYTEIPQRVEFLERQVEHLQDQIDNLRDDVHSQIEQERKDREKAIADLNNTSSNLKTLITDVAVGDLKGQITGFVIITFGTVLSAL